MVINLFTVGEAYHNAVIVNGYKRHIYRFRFIFDKYDISVYIRRTVFVRVRLIFIR